MTGVAWHSSDKCLRKLGCIPRGKNTSVNKKEERSAQQASLGLSVCERIMSQQYRFTCYYHHYYLAVVDFFAIENFWHEHANRANCRRQHRRRYQAHTKAIVNIISSVAEWTASVPVRRTRAEQRIRSAALSMKVNDVLAQPAMRLIVNAFKRRSLNDDSSSILIIWYVLQLLILIVNFFLNFFLTFSTTIYINVNIEFILYLFIYFKNLYIDIFIYSLKL